MTLLQIILLYAATLVVLFNVTAISSGGDASKVNGTAMMTTSALITAFVVSWFSYTGVY
jgi:hypothetical protein